MKPLLYNFDRHLTGWVKNIIPINLQPLMVTITNIGDPIATLAIAICVGLYGLFYNIKLAQASLLIPATLMIGAVIKFIFQRARPLNEYIGLIKIDTYSFPSGHSSGAMVAYGLLAYVAFCKLPAPFNYIVSMALITVPILVGLSRIYLGAHYPSDVLAGWLLGALALAVIVLVIKPFS